MASGEHSKHRFSCAAQPPERRMRLDCVKNENDREAVLLLTAKQTATTFGLMCLTNPIGYADLNAQ